MFFWRFHTFERIVQWKVVVINALFEKTMGVRIAENPSGKTWEDTIGRRKDRIHPPSFEFNGTTKDIETGGKENAGFFSLNNDPKTGGRKKVLIFRWDGRKIGSVFNVRFWLPLICY